MSNITKKIKKNINAEEELFADFQNSIYGSIICSVNALNEKHIDDMEILKRAKKAKFPLSDDEEIVKKTLEAVGMKYEDAVGKPLAIFTSSYNALVSPYVWVEDEQTGEMKIKALSYKRDMTIPRTCYNYEKVFIIEWDSEEDNVEK